MIQTHIHLSSLILLIWVLAVLSPVALANESASSFQGGYAGLSIGKQNYFGGAFLDDLDVLEQKSATLIELSLGWRTRFSGDWIMAVEGAYGIADGNLFRRDGAHTIDYRSDYQLSAGLIAGKIVGQTQDWMLFAYSYFTLREFDVEISSATDSFSQHDEQGVWRYGLGVERQLIENWYIRVTAGRTYVDFGGKETNKKVDNKMDAMLGLVYQF